MSKHDDHDDLEPGCSECEFLVARLAEIRSVLRPSQCRWGCPRPAITKGDGTSRGECAACERTALRHGRDRSGKPIRRGKAVA